MFRPVCCGALLAVCCLMMSGCGGQKLPELGAVTGTITLDGEPLDEALVTFLPDKNRQSYAKTDAAGNYELMFDAKNKGAVVGTHKVTIITQINMVDTPEEKVPAKYNSKTELTAEVTGGDNSIDFELKSK